MMNATAEAAIAAAAAAHNQINGNDGENNQPFDFGKARCRLKKRGLVPSIRVIDTEWQLNFETDVEAVTTVWHRDIVAAKCMLYKGMYCQVDCLKCDTPFE